MTSFYRGGGGGVERNVTKCDGGGGGGGGQIPPFLRDVICGGPFTQSRIEVFIVLIM